MNPTMLRKLVDDVEAFAGELPVDPVLSRRPLEPLRELMSFDVVDRLLTEHTLRHPFVEMVRDGDRLPRERFMSQAAGVPDGFIMLADNALIADELALGSTLVLNDLHFTWQPLKEGCARLGYELGMPVHANAYLTPPRSQGFNHHYDSHSVFILQAEGTKTWQLYRPYLRFPLQRQPWTSRSLPPAEWKRLLEAPPDHEFVLEPGDVLFVPRGWIHNVFTHGDRASLHLTIGVAETSRYRIVSEALDALADEENLRRELPVRFEYDRARAEAAVRDVLADVADWAARADVAALTDRVLAAERARLPVPQVRPVATAVRGGPSLPESVRLRPEAIAGIDRDRDGIALHLGDRVVRFTGGAAAVLDHLLTDPDRPVALAELCPGEAVGPAIQALLAEAVAVPYERSAS